MHEKLFLALVFVGVITGYFERDRLFPTPAPEIVYVTPAPSPKPPERHLAPQGIFFMVDYVSARTKNGVTGFLPGQEVRFVSDNEAKGTLLVTDGNAQVFVTPMQLTNDLDVAALARRQDQQSQGALLAYQESAKQADEQMRRQVAIDQAKDVANIRSSSVIGAGSSLDAPSEAASSYDRAYNKAVSGSPYYYLHRNYYSGVYGY